MFLAPPPSYDSLFGRVREAQKKSKGVIDFLKNIIIIVLGTCKCSFLQENFIQHFLFFCSGVHCDFGGDYSHSDLYDCDGAALLI